MSRLFLFLLLFVAGLSRASVVTLTQCSMSGGQWARILVSLKNRGPGELQSPRVAFDLQVPAGKIPEGQGWDAGNVSVRVEKKSETLWTVWLTSSTNLAEQATWNDGRGVLIGVHLTDWSNWDASPSPSWTSSSNLVENSAVRVYDAAGQIVGGQGSNSGAVSTHSTFALQIDPGGTCNLTGNIVLIRGATLSLRCTPNDGMKLSGWTLDGVGRAATEVIDVLADGANHAVQVQFAARTRLWVSASVEGQGTVQPSGDIAAYQGDTVRIAASAQPGWSLLKWTINGVDGGTNPTLTLPGVQAASTVVAVFRQDATISGINVTAREELPRDPRWSKIYLKVTNTGSTTLAAGYKVRYLFRIPAHQTPSLSQWDVPSATGRLVDLQNGFWAVEFTSGTQLAGGATSGDGRGWYFALQTGSNVNWDTTGNISLPPSGSWLPAPYISVFDPAGNRVAGVDPALSPTYPEGIHVMALYKEGDGDDKWLRPRIIIRNFGSQALSDFVYYWYFRTESGMVPIVTPWFPDSVRPALEALGAGNYRLRFNYSGFTLPPQTDLPTPDGSVTGIALPGYPSWDKSTACSYMSGTTFQPDSAILIYDRNGRLLWGNPASVRACGGAPGDNPGDGDDPGDVGGPEVEYPPFIVVQPRDTTVRSGQSASFETRATGEGTLTYQWRRNGADITGATEPVLDLALVQGSQDGDEFTCAVSNERGTTVSRKAKLRVISPISVGEIVVQPSDDTAFIGGDAVFEVVVSSGEALEFQWYFNGQALRGQNQSRLVVRTVDVRDSGSYWVVITTATGKRLTSRHAHLVLLPSRPSSLVFSISGSFVDSVRTQLPDTTADLVVRLFGAPKGGNPLWTERHFEVPIRTGEWNLTIGSDPQAVGLEQIVSRHSGLYLEVALDGILPVVFGPRVPLTSVPYATSSGARVIYGQGVPQSASLEGVLYLDQTTRKLWQRKSGTWLQLDP